MLVIWINWKKTRENFSFAGNIENGRKDLQIGVTYPWAAIFDFFFLVTRLLYISENQSENLSFSSACVC